MSQNGFWKKYEFSVNQSYKFKAGFVEIEVKLISTGWLIKSRVVDRAFNGLDAIATDTFDDDVQTQLFQTGKSKTLYLVPSLPNKAVVFRNNRNIKISPKGLLDIYFKVPLNIRFYSGQIKDENFLCEIPLQRLSDTWFGEVDSGEPAYSIGSSYSIDMQLMDVAPHEAVCPVSIMNSTTSFLDLQRLILRVEALSLYWVGNHIVASHANIEFAGLDSASDIHSGTRKNIHGEKPLLIAKPRSNDSRNILKKSFYFIKNIYQN